jgi:anaerobic magnesium-protoporphyrin IX monomethyl ester cyclase
MSRPTILLVRTTRPGDLIPPLGVLHLASSIRSAEAFRDHRLQVVDFAYQGLDHAEYAALLGRLAPTHVLFSSLDSEYPLFRELCRLSREHAPRSHLVAGGSLATNYHEDVVRRRLVDVAVRGEGEVTIVELLTALDADAPLHDVKGISFREDGKVVSTPPRDPIEDLDSIPWPAWDLVDLRGYSRVPNWNGELSGKYYAPIMTTRGCAFNCVYCHNLFGRRIRPRSVENVLAEIQMLYLEHGIREIHFIDDFFNYRLDRVQQICRGIVERGLKLKISFPNGLRADRMDMETLRWLKKAGTYKINYAVETASPRLQKLIRKNLDLDRARHWIEETSRLGIITFGFFMFGFPTETGEEMELTGAFARDSRLDTAKFLKVTVFHNTALEALSPRHSMGSLDDLEQLGGDVFHEQASNCSDIPTGMLNRIIGQAQRRFYFQPGRVLRLIRKYGWLVAARRLLSMYRHLAAKQRTEQQGLGSAVG